jgi:hypothetical protein
MTDPHAMAFSGDVVSLRHFLAPLPKPAAANTVSAYRKTTMLYSAARSGHLSVVRMLVEEFGADANHPQRIRGRLIAAPRRLLRGPRRRGAVSSPAWRRRLAEEQLQRAAAQQRGEPGAGGTPVAAH